MIKSNGGVFGRNPTFQDVTVDGNLTVNGDLALGDDITINDTLLVNGVATFKGGIISTGTAAAPTSNTVMGLNAGDTLTTTGTQNTLIGDNAGGNISTGVRNTAIGSLTSDGHNSSDNTIVGSFALRGAAGSHNTAVGVAALFATTGSDNVAVGRDAANAAGAFTHVTAVGRDAAKLNTANDTVAIGSGALHANTTGIHNTAVGRNALGANTTGIFNTVIGRNALLSSMTGDMNTIVGTNSFINISGAEGNCSLGRDTGFNMTSGGNNVALGHNAQRFRGSALDPLVSATNSIFIGFQSRAAGNSQTNQVVIAGADGLGNGSNTTTIGNSSTTGTYLAGRVYPGNNTGFGTPGIYFVGTNAENGNIVGHGLFADMDSRFVVRNKAGTVEYFKVGAGSSGNAELVNGNLVIGTSGKGIDFSATANSSGTMTSELLNDYEEGTWSPAYVPATGSFATMTMAVVSAVYTKVGRQVTVTGNIRTNNVDATGASGTLRISGLPFTVGSSGRSAGVVTAASAWGGDFPATLGVVNGESVIRMYYRDAPDAGDQALDVTDLTTGSTANQNDMYFAITYFT